MDIQNLITIILTSTVVSSFCTVILKNFFDRKNQKDQGFNKRKEDLYINILSFMEMYLDPNSKCSMSVGGYSSHDLNAMTLDEFKKMAEISLHGFIRRGALYFTDELFDVITEFIDQPTYEKYLNVMITMRKDLGYKALKTDSYKLTLKNIVGENSLKEHKE